MESDSPYPFVYMVLFSTCSLTLYYNDKNKFIIYQTIFMFSIFFGSSSMFAGGIDNGDEVVYGDI